MTLCLSLETRHQPTFIFFYFFPPCQFEARLSPSLSEVGVWGTFFAHHFLPWFPWHMLCFPAVDPHSEHLLFTSTSITSELQSFFSMTSMWLKRLRVLSLVTLAGWSFPGDDTFLLQGHWPLNSGLISLTGSIHSYKAIHNGWYASWVKGLGPITFTVIPSYIPWINCPISKRVSHQSICHWAKGPKNSRVTASYTITHRTRCQKKS